MVIGEWFLWWIRFRNCEISTFFAIFSLSNDIYLHFRFSFDLMWSLITLKQYLVINSDFKYYIEKQLNMCLIIFKVSLGFTIGKLDSPKLVTFSEHWTWWERNIDTGYFWWTWRVRYIKSSNFWWWWRVRYIETELSVSSYCTRIHI